MKIYRDIIQGSQAWNRLRALNFTASKLGPFAVEPVKISLTVEEIKAELAARDISYKGVTKRDDLLDMLPGKEAYAKLSPGAKTAVIAQIKSERMQAIRDRIAEANAAGRLFQVTQLEDILLRRDEELDEKEQKQFEWNIPVKYGKLLEPFARAYYQRTTGFGVMEVGFIEHDSGGFGCSPDGLCLHKMFEEISSEPCAEEFSHGVEIKCPVPETHIGWLLDGGLPDEHKLQVHACMAVTGINRWDFLSYCPSEAPLLVTVYREEFTDQLEAGLKQLVAEKAKMERVLTKKREAAYSQKERISA